MPTIEALKKTAREAGEAISQIEIAATKKENGPKIGKTYKTRNCYSCPEKPSDYWWLYARVTGMNEYGHLHVLQFQTDSRRDICINFERYAYHMEGNGWQPITEAEFRRAQEKLFARVATISEIGHRTERGRK